MAYGLKYRINTWYVPHYCVRPIEKVEEKEEIKERVYADKLDKIITQVQDIINKYKK